MKRSSCRPFRCAVSEHHERSDMRSALYSTTTLATSPARSLGLTAVEASPDEARDWEARPIRTEAQTRMSIATHFDITYHTRSLASGIIEITIGHDRSRRRHRTPLSVTAKILILGKANKLVIDRSFTTREPPIRLAVRWWAL